MIIPACRLGKDTNSSSHQHSMSEQPQSKADFQTMQEWVGQLAQTHLGGSAPISATCEAPLCDTGMHRPGKPHLATSPATNAGGWSLPEPPPCPGKVAAMISMTCSTAVFSMKEHSCASSSSRPAGGVDLPDDVAACWPAW